MVSRVLGMIIVRLLEVLLRPSETLGAQNEMGLKGDPGCCLEYVIEELAQQSDPQQCLCLLLSCDEQGCVHGHG